MARRPQRETDQQLIRRLTSEGKSDTEIGAAIRKGLHAEIKPVRARRSKPIQISSEQQIATSASQAARIRDGAGKRTVPSASRTSGPAVNLVRSGRSNPSAKAMGRNTSGSTGARKASGSPIVRSGSGGLSLRGGTRGAWRRDSKGRFS